MSFSSCPVQQSRHIVPVPIPLLATPLRLSSFMRGRRLPRGSVAAAVAETEMPTTDEGQNRLMKVHKNSSRGILVLIQLSY